jgi:hypothetical protein
MTNSHFMVSTTDTLQAKSADIPSLLEDAKLALEHLSEITGDQISEGLNISPNAITTLGILAENARTELEGKDEFDVQLPHGLPSTD